MFIYLTDSSFDVLRPDGRKLKKSGSDHFSRTYSVKPWAKDTKTPRRM